MECGKLTAKLRDAVPVCFMVDGKEVKRYKNIEIPDEIKKLPFKAFDFNVPLTGPSPSRSASSRAYCRKSGRKSASARAGQRKRRKQRYRRM